MKKSREIRSLEILAFTFLSGWRWCFPIDAPATQLAKANGKAKADVTLTPSQSTEAIADLRRKSLLFPIPGFDVERVKSSYSEARGGKPHEAIDIPAPRNTPVLAVDDGKIAKLFLSQAGGTTIYQSDTSKKYIYYYAHLERYADGLANDQVVKKGQVLGYVGTSGDAPANTPHLHFSISLPDVEKKWWQTAPVNPYLVFKK